MSDSNVKTKEELKTEIRDYLVNCTDKDVRIKKITYSGILDEIKDKSENIDTALSELEDENVISSHDISLKIYLPNNDTGNNLLKDLAKKELIFISTNWLFLFSLALLYVGSKYFITNSLPDNLVGATVLGAYRSGFEESIVFSAITGIVGAHLLLGLTSKLKQMQILTPELYSDINTIARNTILLSIIGWVGSSFIEKEFGLTIAKEPIAIFALSFGIAVFYSKLRTNNNKTVSIM